MDGSKSDISFTSPPYNVGHNLGYDNDNKYENYKDDNPEYLDLLIKSTEISLNNSVYSFVNLQFLAGNKREILDYLYVFKEKFADIAFWKKLQVQPAMANNVMNSQTECVFIFSNESKSRAINTGEFRGNVSNIIETNSVSSENKNSKIHSATFPIKFVSYFVDNFSKKGDTVLDPFGGLGSTLIACEQTDRTCFMMERDPNYCDVIRKRYYKFIGKEEEWNLK